jgi:thioredoxin-related protein
MRVIATAISVVAAVLLVFQPLHAQSDTSNVAIVEAAKFDPSRDAEQDIQMGIAEAQRTGRHVILDVGGEWCIWCHRLDAFFSENKDVSDVLKTNYVIIKVNYSKENKNEKVLSRYPKVSGYPHLFVLDQKGTLLHSQNTGDLESGKGYDRSKILTFLAAWAPKSEK